MSRLGLDWSMISNLLGWSSSILSSSVITGRVEYFSSKLCITSSVEVMKVEICCCKFLMIISS